MKTSGTTSFFKQVFGVVLTVFLVLLPLGYFIFSFGPKMFLGTFTHVLSGQIFNEGWDRIHAGFVLDQPTIGKWYFWFTVFSMAGLPYMAMVQRFCVHESKVRNWIFVTGLTVLCLFLVCLLTNPFWWLIQYIHEMGWTQKRFYGLFYGIGGYLVVSWFWYRAVKLIRMKDVSHSE